VEAYTRVSHEVRSTFTSVSTIRAGPLLSSCIYLRASINEAMRLSPVGSQPLWREAETGGCIVDGNVIPSGLNIGCGIYSLHHNPDAFVNPYDYNIERWICQNGSEEEKQRIKEMTSSFAPFSTGPRQCIGKNLAMMELMLTMANVFWSLDFEGVGTLGEGRKGMGRGRERQCEFQLKSYFTSHMDGPMVRFRKRNV
jgi:cytochrome P450